MEYALTKEVMARGKGSAMIPLTADMMERYGIKVGSPVVFYYDGDSLVLKFPKDGKPAEVEEKGEGF